MAVSMGGRSQAYPDRLHEDARLFKQLGAGVFRFTFSFFYALFLANLPLLEFKDRVNYLDYVRYGELILASYAFDGWKSVLANEPLWLLTNIWLASFINDPETVLQVIIFVPAFVVSYQILRKNPVHAGWLVLFLFAPQVIKNHIIHLRQGFGIALFLLGYYNRRAWIRYPLMLIAGFIHSSFFIVNLVSLFAWVSGKIRLASGLRIAILLAVFVSICMLLEVLAAGLGARQGTQYAEAELDVSGLGFLIWTTIFILFISSRTEFLISHFFPLSILVFYLSSYFVSPVSGRIFESGLLLVFLAGLSLTGWRRQMFLGMVMGYSLLVYATKIGQPMLGWGIR